MSEPEPNWTQSSPRAFISYSHDSPEHSARVLAFAGALRRNGIDVELDQFHQDTIIDWPRWCNEQTDREHSDFVLCICTAEYCRRIEGKVPPEKGKGIYWEGSLLDDELYDKKGNRRILTVLFDQEPETAIPRFLRGWTFCRITRFDLEDSGYVNLIRILSKQERVVKIPVGSIPKLPQTAPCDTTSEGPARIRPPSRISSLIHSATQRPTRKNLIRVLISIVVLVLFGIAFPYANNFLTYRICITPLKDCQDPEIEIVRVWNPFQFRISTGLVARSAKSGEAIDFYLLNDAIEALVPLVPEQAAAELVLKTSDGDIGAVRFLRLPSTPGDPKFATFCAVEPRLKEALSTYFNATSSTGRSKGEAAATLVRLGVTDKAVVASLVTMLRDNAADVRLTAVRALGELGNPDNSVIAGLQLLLKDKEPEVRLRVAESLAKQGVVSPPVLDAFVGVLMDGAPNSNVHSCAVQALMKLENSIDPVAVKLAEFVKGEDRDARLRAAKVLVELGKQDTTTVRMLSDSSKDCDSFNRRRIIDVLDLIENPDKQVKDALYEFTHDANPEVAGRAGEALLKLQFIDVLRSASWNVDPADGGLKARQPFPTRSQKPPEVVSLLAFCTNPNPAVRRATAKVAEDSGVLTDQVVTQLSDLLKDRDLSVRQAAAEALGRLGQKRADWRDDRRLLLMLQSNLSERRQTAGLVLAYRENLDSQTINALQKLRSCKMPFVRMAAWDTLLMIEEHKQRLRRYK
jgi:HEAT repeat protein